VWVSTSGPPPCCELNTIPIVLSYISTAPSSPAVASRGAPRDFARVVGANHVRMKGWIWATSEPCTSIGEQEVRRIRRNLETVRPGAVPPARAARRWGLVAVLLCPGDTAATVVAWLGGLRGAEPDRVRFYVHPGTDLVAALSPWFASGWDDPFTAEVEDFATFHRQFGWDFNNQVYRDAAGSA